MKRSISCECYAASAGLWCNMSPLALSWCNHTSAIQRACVGTPYYFMSLQLLVRPGYCGAAFLVKKVVCSSVPARYDASLFCKVAREILVLVFKASYVPGCLCVT